MRRFLSLAALVLAGLSTWVGVTARPGNEASTLFSQGALIPLVDAERALEQGAPADALEHFQKALLRARREGREDLLLRIRMRMLDAGKKVASTKGLSQGWPLMERACLLGEPFSDSARSVEEWALTQGLSNGRFEYSIVQADGEARAWAVRPGKVPVWLLRFLDPATHLGPYAGLLYNERGESLPPSWPYAHIYNIRFVAEKSKGVTEYVVRTPKPAAYPWYLSVYNSVLWNPPILPKDGQSTSFNLKEPPQEYVVDRVVVFDNGDLPQGEVLAVHTYEALE